MSRRHRRQGGGQAAAAGGRQQVERLLQKGRIKDAFKQAKLCFREEASDDNRRLLERVYLLRVQDLSRSGMPAAAAEVARSFLDFGVSEPQTAGELAALLPQLGLMEEARRLGGRLHEPEAHAALSVSLADQAVLHPERTPSSLADVREGATRIRSALAALDAEHEEHAIELLKDIPRSSPWADWRYFVRGLAAFRRGDRAQATANWERLDPQRAAQRIAANLKALPAARLPGEPPGDSQRRELSRVDLSRLESAAFGEPLLARLDRLRRLVDKTNPKRDWKQALALLAPLNASLRRIDRRLAQRLTEILLPLVIDEATGRRLNAGQNLINEFIRAAEPWPLDPQWSRLWALCWELASDAGTTVGHWEKYIRDVESLVDVDADKRRGIQALVWWHIAKLLADEVRDAQMPWTRGNPDEELASLRSRTLAALDESLRLNPLRRDTHDFLIGLYTDWDEPERAIEATRRLLAHFPDDLSALSTLAEFHFGRSEPFEALDYVRRARQVKPLDTKLKDLEYWSLVGVARLRALSGRWDEGRAAFAAAAAIVPEDAADYTVVARRALFELKAGDRQRSAELIERAKTLLAESAPLWLVLAIEARRYDLPAARAAEFNAELRPLLKKKKSGETAGRLATLMLAYRAAGFDYPEKEQHWAAVLGYIRATTRTRYAEEDLRHVCHFLVESGEESSLLPKFIRRGRKSFPRSPYFLMFAAGQDLQRGPLNCNLYNVRRQMEKALALAEADPQARYAELIPELKRKLAEFGNLDTMASMLNHFGGNEHSDHNFPGFSQMIDVLDQFAEEFDEEDDSDDEGANDFAEFFRRGFEQAGMPPNRGKRNRRRAK